MRAMPPKGPSRSRGRDAVSEPRSSVGPRQERDLEPCCHRFGWSSAPSEDLNLGDLPDTVPPSRCRAGGQTRACRRAGAGSPQDPGISEGFLQNGLSEPRESASDCFSSEAPSGARPEAFCGKLTPGRSCRSRSPDTGLLLTPAGKWGFVQSWARQLARASPAPLSAAARLPRSSRRT